MSLRCGRIGYTNDLPIYAAFDEGAVPHSGTLHADTPAMLNAMMRRGDLDAGPISAFAYAAEPQRYALLPEICIGARSEACSVVLVSPTAPALLEGARIAITEESATARKLLRILLERRYAVRAHYIDDRDALRAAENGQPALLIGDTAIDAIFKLDPATVYDLGTLWHEWTGEDSIFAVWAARREIYESDPGAVQAYVQTLREAYAWGQANMPRVVALAQRSRSRPAGFYESYYAKLNFSFDANAQAALETFCGQLLAIGAIASIPSVTPEAVLAPS